MQKRRKWVRATCTATERPDGPAAEWTFDRAPTLSGNDRLEWPERMRPAAPAVGDVISLRIIHR